MSDDQSGHQALDAIDRTLAARPRRDGDALKAAVQDLAAFRDHTIERHRQEGGRRDRITLDQVNAVISVTMAVQFPLGEVPWGELEKARGWLDAILRDGAAQ